MTVRREPAAQILPGAVLVARVILGALLAYAGAAKIGHADVFAAEIAGFRILPPAMVAPLALLLPFFELGVGIYLFIGLYTRVAAFLAAAEFALFAVAIASAVLRGIQTSCGCFGPSDRSVTSWPEVARDAAFVLWALFVAWRAPGMLAVDRRIGNVS